MKDEPLGLPRGSVRALIALIFVITACACAILGKETPEWIINALLLIVGFYFGTRRIGNES
jgi:type IV secretory pathway VirB2 component (pilin)